MSVAEIFIPRKVWTRVEAEKIDPALAESLELVNGELIDRMGKKVPHVFWTMTLARWLRQQFGEEFVRTEAPIDVSPEDNPLNEPEPDITVTTRPLTITDLQNPKPCDVRLVVEISDTTFELDRKVKAPLYARAGIPECWVVDVRNITAPRLLLHQDPQKGSYQSVETFGCTAHLRVLGGQFLCLANLIESGKV